MFEELSDNQLIALYKEGDTDAFAAICARYGRLMKSLSRRYFIFGGDEDDLFQEGLIGLLKAVVSYSGDKGMNFASFAKLCVDRNIKTAISKANKKSNSPLNNAVSLDRILIIVDPEEKVIDRETRTEKSAEIRKGLTAFENGVFDCYLSGFSFAETAEKMDISVKSAYNAIQRVKKKIVDNFTEMFGEKNEKDEKDAV